MVGCTPTPTVLFVSSDPEVIDLMGSVQAVVPKMRLEHRTNFDLVPSMVRQGEADLVIVHVSGSADQAAAKELLWSMTHTDHPVAFVLVLDDCDDGLRNQFLRAGAACCFPRTVSLRKLAHTVQSLTFLGRNIDSQPAECAEVDVDVANPDPTFYVLSAEMRHLMEQVRQVVPQDTTILFTGETGTGKTRLARLIHEMSPRSKEPFLVVDCNALSPSLIESELFGHVKGSFTGAERDRQGKFAAAGRGTIVLDEINSLPLGLQSKLLRAVDGRVFEPVGSNSSQPLRARVITISNANLEQEVAAGRFRADLFYRLNVVGFYMPCLRDRIGAIGPMAQRFLAKSASNTRPDKSSITADALRALERYHWPGNIRELCNVIERAVTLFPGPMVELSHLPEALRANDVQHAATLLAPREFRKESHNFPLPSRVTTNGDDLTLMKTKEKAEILRITEALRKNSNNRLRTAAELGISRMALYKKLHKYGLHSPTA